MKESGNRIRIKYLSKPRTQPSLFHYIKETPDPSVFEDIDWSFLRHPIRSFIEWRRATPHEAIPFSLH